MIVLSEGIWSTLKASEEFESMKVDLEQSYVWDRLIELLSNDLLSGQMFDMHSQEVTDNELALVTMALEPRLNRAVLAEAWLEFLQNPGLKSAARMIQGRMGHAYVWELYTMLHNARHVSKCCKREIRRLPGSHWPHPGIFRPFCSFL